MKQRIIVVSDSHGDIEKLEKIFSKEKNYSYILHLGDHHDDLDMVETDLSKVEIKSVRGNCDFVKKEEEIFFEINGLKIYMTHGHLYSVKYGYQNLFYKANEIGADLALFGHTHEKFNEKMGSVRLFNPGAVNSYRSFTASSYGVLIVDEDGKYEIFHKKI